jgi:hypothetical protein
MLLSSTPQKPANELVAENHKRNANYHTGSGSEISFHLCNVSRRQFKDRYGVSHTGHQSHRESSETALYFVHCFIPLLLYFLRGNLKI